MNDKDLVEFFIYLRDYCYNRDFQIAPEKVVECFREHQFERLHKPVVMQAEGSDGAKGATVGQRSGGTNAEGAEFCQCGNPSGMGYCHFKPIYICGDCKRREAPAGGHL